MRLRFQKCLYCIHLTRCSYTRVTRTVCPCTVAFRSVSGRGQNDWKPTKPLGTSPRVTDLKYFVQSSEWKSTRKCLIFPWYDVNVLLFKILLSYLGWPAKIRRTSTKRASKTRTDKQWLGLFVSADWIGYDWIGSDYISNMESASVRSLLSSRQGICKIEESVRKQNICKNG